jgi:hypothetical protein
MGCLSLPFVLVGGCIAGVFVLEATILDAGEPDVIRRVEPDWVTRVLEVDEYAAGTDDVANYRILLFYRSERPFAEVERAYIEAMEAEGYSAEVTGFLDGDRRVRFFKGDQYSCFELGTYPDGVFYYHDYRPAELETLRPTQSAFVIAYGEREGWIRTTHSCD